MLTISNSEWLFYGGIAMMVAAVLLATVCIVIFKSTKKRLFKKFEQEYGEM